MATAASEFGAWVTDRTVDELSASLQDPAPVAARRREALRRFRELPLEPNPLYRKYGYFAGVDLSEILPARLGAPVIPPPPQEGTVEILHDVAGTHVRLSPELRDAGVTVTPLVAVLAEGEAARAAFFRGEEEPTDRLSALTTALVNRGYRLEIPARCPIPVRVKDSTVLCRPGEALSMRRSVKVGAESRLLFSEEIFSKASPPPQQRLVGSSTDLELGDGARGVYLTLHAPDPRAVSLFQRHATLARAARLTWAWAGFGGFRTKARNLSVLVGPGSALEDLQAFYGAGETAYDSAVHITHVGTDTQGQSVTRGVFRDSARGMSRGLVRIEKEARKTISFLSEHAMLLSRGARSDTIPILEILCRDVKATHSSSVAPVDPERVFYLESRGISETESVRMIAEGFLAHVLDRVPVAGLRETLYPYLAARWEGRSAIWLDPATPSLPPLSYGGADVGPDWRFDSKLR